MPLSDDHKAALAQGRSEARTVGRYLDTLSTKRPRGAANAEALKERLDRLTDQIEAEQNSLKRLNLIQRRFDIEDRLKMVDASVDYEQLETDFVGVAASYSQRKNISYSAWREFGVTPEVLKTAGVKRTRRT